jgi:hypothetical protein
MEENLAREIGYIAESTEPEIVFEVALPKGSLIYFREVEDWIAYIMRKGLKGEPRITGFLDKAYRYSCSEGVGSRYYYMLTAVTSDGRKVKLVAPDATDYSGHGGHDKLLAEYFITKILGIHIEDYPASYLISDLVDVIARFLGGRVVEATP